VTVTLFEYQQLFPGVSTAHLESAAPWLQAMRAEAGQEVAQVGAEDPSVICVVEGRLEVSRAGVLLAPVGPGEIIGEITLFGYRPARTATVRARTPCRLVRVSAAGFQRLAEQDNGVAWVIERLAIEQLAARARRAEATIIRQAHGTPFRFPVPEPETGWWPRLRDLIRGSRPEPGPTPLSCDIGAELALLPKLEGVPSDALGAVAAWFEAWSFPAHYPLFRQGEPGDRWYLLLAGQVTRLFELPTDGAADPTTLRVHRLKPSGAGDTLGVTSQIDGRNRSLTALSDTPLRALVMKQSRWHRAVASSTPAASVLRRMIIRSMIDELEARNETVIWLERATGPLRRVAEAADDPAPSTLPS
jgi:CRP-like cAMP-binding protein